jgi:hypothetical protein
VKRILNSAMIGCIGAQLGVGLVLTSVSTGEWQLAIIAATVLFAALSGAAMFAQRRTAFSICAGALLVFQCCAGVLATDLGFAGAWMALGVGLICLLVGNQALLSSGLYPAVSQSSLSSQEVLSATRRSFWRMLFFVALVMACSMLVLFLILAMDFGSLTLPFLLLAGLLLMISIYYLATHGTVGDEEKPNI